MLPPGQPWGPLQASALLVSPVLPIPCSYSGGQQECNTFGGLLYYLALHLNVCICRVCKNAAGGQRICCILAEATYANMCGLLLVCCFCM